MNPVYVHSDVVIPETLSIQFNKALSLLASTPYSHSLNLEKMGHIGGLSSIRINLVHRLLLLPFKKNEQLCWMVVDLILNHDYQKSTFIKKANISRMMAALDSDSTPFIQNLSQEELMLEAEDNKDEVVGVKEITFYNQKVISLTDEQLKIFQQPLPCVVSGPAGSGKTSIIPNLISQLVLSTSKQEDRAILYLCKSEALAQQTRDNWLALPDSTELQNVLFLSYQQMMQEVDALKDAKIVHNEHLIFWLTDNIKKNTQLAKSQKRTELNSIHETDLSKLVQEFHLISHLSLEDVAQYKQLGQRKSFYSKTPKADNVFNLYCDYLKYLSRSNLIHPGFYKLAGRAQYLAILVDESQDLSTQQITMLLQLTVQNNVIFFTDAHQSLDKSISTTPFLLELVGGESNLIKLSKIFRSPFLHTLGANKILALKRKLISGNVDKVSAIDVVSDQKTQGILQRYNSMTEVENQGIMAALKGTAFVVLANGADREEARQIFGTPLVYTPEEFKGLEGHTIFCYDLLKEDLIKPIMVNTNGIQDTEHRSKKAGQAHDNTHLAIQLNRLFVAFTRSTSTLYLIQKNSRYVDQFLDYVLINPTLKLSANGTASSLPEVLNYEKEINKNIKAGNKKVVDAINTAQNNVKEREAASRKTIEKDVDESINTAVSLVATSDGQKEETKQRKRNKKKKKSTLTIESLANNTLMINDLTTKDKNNISKLEALILNDPGSLLELMSKSSLFSKFTSELLLNTQFFCYESKTKQKVRLTILQALSSTQVGLEILKEIIAASPSVKNEAFVVKLFEPFELPTSTKESFPIDKLLLVFSLNNDSALHQLFLDKIDLCKVMLQESSARISDFKSHLRGFLNNFIKLVSYIKAKVKRFDSIGDAPHVSFFNQRETLILPLPLQILFNNLVGAAAAEGDVARIKLLHGAGVDLNQQMPNGMTAACIAAQYGHTTIIEELSIAGSDLDKPMPSGSTPAFIAAQEGHVSVIKTLINKGVDINKVRNDGVTPANIAVVRGHVFVIEILANAGADLNAANTHGETPAHIAAQYGHTTIMQVLVSAGVDLNKVTKNGATPTLVAAYVGHYSIIKLLIEGGASLNTANTNDDTPVFLAAQQGHSSILEALVSAGADFNKVNKNGVAPAFIAAKEGHCSVIKVLINAGVDLNEANTHGQTPVFLAAYAGHDSFIKTLINAEVDLNKASRDGVTPAIIAACNGNYSALKILARAGADLNQADINGVTPALVAAQEGHYLIIELLANFKEVDLSLAQPKSGKTPAWIAARYGHCSVIKALANAKVDLNKEIKDGTTPAYIAAEAGHASIITALANAGANLDQADTNGVTPALIAAQEDHYSAIEALANANADLDKALPSDGRTPAYIAAQQGHDLVIKALARAGANLNTAMNDGTTPMYAAAQNGYHLVISVLANYGADLDKAVENVVTPAFIAAQEGHVSVIEALANAGANLNSPMKYGVSPALIAARRGHDSVIAVLAKAGADLNHAMEDGTTPALIAAQEGHSSVIKALEDAGADLGPAAPDSAFCP